MGTEGPSIVDIHVFTTVERILYLENSSFNDVFEKLNFREIAPSIEPFVKNIREHPLLREEVMSIKAYNNIMDDIRNNPVKPVLQIKYLD